MNSDGATQFWGGTSLDLWTDSKWGSSVSGPFTASWSSSTAQFDQANGTIKGATTTFNGITANENVTVIANGTLGTGGAVATITVANGKTFDFGSQVFSTASGTGLIKSGSGTLTGNLNAYPGGFTINAGIVSISGVNTLGAGALTINGGTIQGSSGASRDLSGKATGITIGGDFAFAGTAALTFSAAVSIGGSARTITNNNTAPVIFNGIISGTSGNGIIKVGAGTLVFGGANTYDGSTRINAGTLTLSNSASLASSIIQISGGATLDVSGRNTTLTLGSSQTLAATNANSFSAVVKCESSAGLTMGISSPLSLAYSNGTPALNIIGGPLTLASGNPVTLIITNGGNRLPGGAAGTDYKLISKSAGGSVAGAAPASVSVAGDGIAAGGVPTLVISSGELYLRVTTTPSAPTMNAASATNSSGFTASWNSTSGASGYRIDVSLIADFSSSIYTNVDAVNATSYVVSGLTASTAYYYRVRATNSAGASAHSSAIRVDTTSGGVPPGILTQPTSQTNNYNTTATFAVSASGDAPLSYHWLTNSVALGDSTKFGGTATSSLSISNLIYTDAVTSLTVVVTNNFGAVTSSIITLTVVDPFIVAQPVSVTNAFQATVTFSAQASGSGTVTYQWRTNGVSIVNGGRFSGATSGSLSIVSVAPGDTNWNYSVAIGGAGISVTSAVVTLTITNISAPYRSKASGFWSDANTWQEFINSTWIDAIGTPTSSDLGIQIQSGHIVTNVANLTIDQVTVDAGGQITIGNGATLTLANGTGVDLVINGTALNQGTISDNSGVTISLNAGGTYIHNTTSSPSDVLGDITCAATSTWIYRGSSTLTPSVSTSGRTYGNLRFESTSGNWSATPSGVNALVVNGDFYIGTGVTYTTSQAGEMTFGGNFTIDGTLGNAANTQIYTFTGGGKTISGAASSIGFETWNVSSSASITLGHNVAIDSTFTASIAGTLNCSTFVITGAGAFTLASGATLGMGSADGLSSTASTGNVQVTGTRTFSSAANYIYNGISAQITGNQLPATVNTLSINTTAGVALTANVAVNGTLAINAGAFDLNAKTVTGTANIASGGTLKGAGIVTGTATVNSGGTISPGSSIGTITFNSVPSLAGTNVMEIDRNAGTPLADKVILSSGTLNYGGTLTVNNAGAALIAGDTFDLFDALSPLNSFSGAFAFTNLPSLSSGLNWYLGNLTANGTIIVNGSPALISPITSNCTPTLSVVIQVTGTGGLASDPEGDAVTATLGTGPVNGTNLIFTAGGSSYIYYQNTNAATSSDSFTYLVSDGRGGSATGTITITMVIPLAQAQGALFPPEVIGAGPAVRLKLLGYPGYTYALEWTNNMGGSSPWIPLSTNQANGTGLLVFTNSTPDASANFYRTRWVP